MSGYRLTRLGTTCFYFNALMGIGALNIPWALSHGTNLGLFAAAVLLAFIAIMAWVVANQMIGNLKQADSERHLLQPARVPLLNLGEPEPPSESSETRVTILDFVGIRISWLESIMEVFMWTFFLMGWCCIVVENSSSFATQVAAVVPEDSKTTANIISILFLLLIALVTQMLNLKTMEKLQIAMAVCRILILILIGISWSVISNLEKENQDSNNLEHLHAKEVSTSFMSLASTVLVMFCGFFLHVALPSIAAVSRAEEQSATNTIAIFMTYVICLILGGLYPSFPHYASVQLNSLASSDPLLYYLGSFAVQLGPAIIAMLEVNLYWWIYRQLIVEGPCSNKAGIFDEQCVKIMRWGFLLFPWVLYFGIFIYKLCPISNFWTYVSAILMSLVATYIYLLVPIGYALHVKDWKSQLICLQLTATAIAYLGLAWFGLVFFGVLGKQFKA